MTMYPPWLISSFISILYNFNHINCHHDFKNFQDVDSSIIVTMDKSFPFGQVKRFKSRSPVSWSAAAAASGKRTAVAAATRAARTSGVVSSGILGEDLWEMGMKMYSLVN